MVPERTDNERPTAAGARPPLAVDGTHDIDGTRERGTGPGRAARDRKWPVAVLAIGIVLAALNLRPAVSGLGALLEEARAGLGMSGAVAGLLTSVPTLCFAVFGTSAPRLARRFGAAPVMAGALAAVAAGLLVRPYIGGTAAFLLFSALALMGIAVANVLMPVIVKHWFPGRIGTMTGLYSLGLSLGTASAAALTVPLTSALGGDWRRGLAVWGVLALVALVPWIAFAGGGVPAGTTTGTRDESRRPIRVGRTPVAWALACFFGLQATGAYVTMGWMPQIFRDAGVPAGEAGVLLAVTMAMGVPLAFVIPRLAARLPRQGPLVVALGTCGVLGYVGLWSAPASGAWAWAVLLGISNCAFPLALTMIGMRARTGVGVAALSSFVQSTGYLIALPGPLLVGVLYEHTGEWDVPLALMTALLVPQILLGVLAGRPRTVEDAVAG